MFQQQYHDRWVCPVSEYPETDQGEKWEINPVCFFFSSREVHQVFQTMIIHVLSTFVPPIFVSWIATMWGWWKSRKANNSNFLPLMLLMFMLTNFSPPVKLFLCQMKKTQFSFLLSGIKSILISKFNWSPKKESEKLKNAHFGQIQVHFVFCKVSYWDSVMEEHPLWTHISQLSHWTALWSFRTAPRHNPPSALQFVQYQDPFSDSNFNSSLSPSLAHDAWKRFSQSLHSTALTDALQYFLQRQHWNLGPGFISISPARMKRVIRLVPFEGLKLHNPSELLRFPSFLVYAIGEIFVTNLTFLVWVSRFHYLTNGP